MGVSKESIKKILIGNRFHVKLRILSPENCKQSLRVKSWKVEVTAEKSCYFSLWSDSRGQILFRNETGKRSSLFVRPHWYLSRWNVLLADARRRLRERLRAWNAKSRDVLLWTFCRVPMRFRIYIYMFFSRPSPDLFPFFLLDQLLRMTYLGQIHAL